MAIAEVGIVAWVKANLVGVLSAIGGFLFAIFKVGKVVQAVLDRLYQVESDVIELKESQQKQDLEISDLKSDVASIKRSTKRIEQQVDMLVEKLINKK